MSEGIVYILTNEAMPDYIKIGHTKRENLKTRMEELYNSGVPFPFELHYAAKVLNAKETETRLHAIFAPHRQNKNREFFKMEPERAAIALQMAGGIKITLDDSEVYNDEQLAEVQKNRKTPKPAFKFEQLQIPIDTELTFSRDENIKCVVVQNNKVKYQGKEYSLTALTKELLHSKYGVQGGLYWLYEEELLTERRSRLEKENEIKE